MSPLPWALFAAAVIAGVAPVKSLTQAYNLDGYSEGDEIVGLDLWIDDDAALLDGIDKLRMHDCRIVFRDGAGLRLKNLDDFYGYNIDIVHISPPGDLSTFVQPPDATSLDDLYESHKPPPTGVGGFSYPIEWYPVDDDFSDPRIYSAMQEGITLSNCTNTRLRNIRGRNCSVLIIATNCPGIHVSRIEGHDMRGPFYRGQLWQFDHCEGYVVEDFYCQNALDDSWVEDNGSAFHSDGGIIRRGLIDGNNAPLGVGIMLEVSSDTLVEDVDCINMGNGAFSSYGWFPSVDEPDDPGPDGHAHNNIFRRCRAKYSHHRTKRGSVASGYMFQAVGGTHHVIYDDCVGYGPDPEAGTSLGEPDANGVIPGLLLVEPGATTDDDGVVHNDVREEDFTPRTWTPITFLWDDYKGGPYAATLNAGPGQGRPQLDETATAGTYVGQLDAISADPDETFTWTLLDDAGKFELFSGNKIRTTATRFSWEETDLETISVRCTGSRGQHIDVDCPIAINPIDPVGEDVINGAIVGTIGDDGKFPDGMVWDSPAANVTIEILDLPIVDDFMHAMKIKLTCDLDSGGITPINIFWNNGLGRTGPAANGDMFDIQAFVARDPDDPVQVLSNAGISIVQYDAGFSNIKSDTFSHGLTFDFGLSNRLSRLGNHAFTLDGGGSVHGVSGAFYWEFPAGTGTLEQTLYVCGAKLNQVSGAYMLADPSIFDGHRPGASAGSPGNLPTNWGEDPHNLTRQIVGTGTTEGVQYFDYLATATGADPSTSIYFEHDWGAGSIAALAGDNVIAEICVQILEYTNGGVIEQALQIYELDATPDALGSPHQETFPWASSNQPYIAGYRKLDITMAQASAAKVTGAIYFKLASSSATAKIRIAARLRNLG